MIFLQNKAILVTRDERGAKQLADKITSYGGRPILSPLLAIDCLPLQDENTDICSFDWVFFTSQNGVDCFLKQDQFAKRLHDCRIAAVGPKTAEKVKRSGYQVDFIPSVYNAKVMAEEFLATYDDARSILLVQGVLSRRILADALNGSGKSCSSLEVYDTGTNHKEKDALNVALANGNVDILTFASPSAVDAFIELAEQTNQYLHVPVACIGTTTEKRALEVGFTQTIIPEEFTIDSMIEAISDFLTRKDEDSL